MDTYGSTYVYIFSWFETITCAHEMRRRTETLHLTNHGKMSRVDRSILLRCTNIRNAKLCNNDKMKITSTVCAVKQYQIRSCMVSTRNACLCTSVPRQTMLQQQQQHVPYTPARRCTRFGNPRIHWKYTSIFCQQHTTMQ